jgi:hypothetical protein
MSASDDVIGGGCAIGFIMLWVAAGIGWILNIAKIVGSINDPITGMLIFRAVGVFLFPVGCVLGWF